MKFLTYLLFCVLGLTVQLNAQTVFPSFEWYPTPPREFVANEYQAFTPNAPFFVDVANASFANRLLPASSFQSDSLLQIEVTNTSAMRSLNPNDASILEESLAQFLTKKITSAKLGSMMQLIQQFYEETYDVQAYPTVNPEKSTSDALVINVVLPTISQINWQGFTLREQAYANLTLGLSEGDFLRFNQLNKLQEELGLRNEGNVYATASIRGDSNEATLTIKRNKRLLKPITGYLGYANTGQRAIGIHRLTGGLTWNNLGAKNHTLSYSFNVSTDQPGDFFAQYFNWSIPLSTEFRLDIDASHTNEVSPFVGEGIDFSWKHNAINATLFHTFVQNDVYRWDYTFGVHTQYLRQTTNFSGVALDTTVSNPMRIVTFSTGTSTLIRHGLGHSTFEGNLVVAPFASLSENNTSANLSAVRPETNTQFLYLTFTNDNTIRYDWWASFRLFQHYRASTKRLPYMEMMAIGGLQSVRGYDDRTMFIDSGVRYTLEYYPLNIEWGMKTTKGVLPSDFKLYGFVDYAYGTTLLVQPNEQNNATFSSVGIGIKASIAQQFFLQADFGWGLHEVPSGVTNVVPNQGTERGHIGLYFTF